MSIQVTFTAASVSDLHGQLRDFLGVTVTGPTAAVPSAAQPQAAQAASPSPAPSATSQVTSNAATTTEAAGGATTASPSDGAAGEKALDYNADVKPAVLKVSQKHARAGVEKLLGPFNVDNANKLDPSQWPALIAAAEKLVAADDLASV